VVEKKKKIIMRPGTGAAAKPKGPQPGAVPGISKGPKPPMTPMAPKKPAAPKPAIAPKPQQRRNVDVAAEAARKLGLSKAEFLKRQAALSSAQKQQEERALLRKAEEEARLARVEQERALLEEKRREQDAIEMKRLEEEEAAKKKIEAEEAAKVQKKAVGSPLAKKDEKKSDTRSELEKAGGRVKKKRATPPPTRSKGETKRRRGKLTIVSALSGNDDRQRSLASMKRAREREKARQRGAGRGGDKVQREVVIPETLTIADLANRMSERGNAVIKYLQTQGESHGVNDIIDADLAELIVEDFGHIVKRVSDADVEHDFIIDDTPSDESDRKSRAPVIAIMGHVDHGKTSLLDALRTTDVDVAAGEAGGITQHIGAYQIKLKSGDKITVLDTPGHAAFSQMRTRGAEAVDIVVLVVAADDGVMPQTIESIKYAQGAGKPIIVAINKMDSYDANPTKVETDLLQHSIITESMSGETQAIQVSAKEKTGLQDLAEAIVNQAELMELKANPTRNADGLVIESKIEKGRGAVATLLVKRGTLKRGAVIVAGEHWGKVKALMDEKGKTLKTAGPSEAVELMGLDGAPMPGEPFAVVSDEQKAREICEYRVQKRKDAALEVPSAMASMEQMMAKLQNKEVSDLPLLVKADVEGSAQAIKSSLEGLGNDEVRAKVVYSAAGGISESDVQQAKISGAPIIAFNVRANRQAKDMAAREGVEIRYYSIIYELLDEIKGALEGMLKQERRETFIGYAEALEIFDISKLGNIAGCKVTEGRVERGAGVRLLRDDVVIHEGYLSTLRRFKDEVPKVQAGMECGMGFEGYHDLRKGDQIECFTVEMLDRTLD
jgi:translation initiation factor IF-2